MTKHKNTLTMTSRLFYGLTLGTLLPLFHGCGASPLDLLNQEQVFELISPAVIESKAKFKSIDSEELGARVKYLFVIDKSGSNYFNALNEPKKGSDVDGRRRFKAILDFVETASQNPAEEKGRYFGLVSFQDAAYQVSQFTNDRNLFRSKLLTQKPRDEGDCDVANYDPNSSQVVCDGNKTSYQSALTVAQNLIDEDIVQSLRDKDQDNGIISSYVIFLITDGFPTDTDFLSTGAKPTYYDSQIKNLVQIKGSAREIVASIGLHTGFYTSVDIDENAAGLLRNMAKTGKGEFHSFSGEEAVDFGSYKAPKVKIPSQLVDVFVTNTSVVWELELTSMKMVMMMDSDGDGLSDEIEIQLGSQPTLPDSDGNGVSDYVENLRFGRPCYSVGCSQVEAIDFKGAGASCEGSKVTVIAGKTVFADTDGDGLNDCDEQLLNLDPLLFDTNGDWIPDYYAVHARLPSLKGSNIASIDGDNDSVVNYDEVKRNTPINYQNSRLFDVPVFDYDFLITDATDTHTYYGVDVKRIPYVKDPSQNNIRVFVLERLMFGKDIRFLRSADGHLDSKGNLSIEPEAFSLKSKQCSDSICGE